MATRQSFATASIEGRTWSATGLASAAFGRTALAKSIARPIVRLSDRFRTRRVIDELMALDDRLLTDIGIRREEIEYAARFGRLPERENGPGRR